eukprot:gnl/TRDRNA2_/TRDRNA2_40501_c0_seq1.p1 gnl/TRDRNA2_/TRDRNA2_40501_c0~~gnl/TRDRNA2_/TRDRNA2_40501_c0_seq1.p1  ORF type:complete len:351 (-),score=65.47 gnl/TRDRNA2_/TRDRNA2_40501_c0_seq1:92-1144(-)
MVPWKKKAETPDIFLNHGAKIDPETVTQVLKDAVKAQPEQIEFFEVWCRCIYEPLHSAGLILHSHMQVRTNMDHLEFRIRGASENMMTNMAEFMNEIEMPVEMGEVMITTQEEMPAEEMTLWVCMHQCTTSEPAIDAGYCFHRDYDWEDENHALTMDMILPQVEDYEWLKEYCKKAQYSADAFETSMFPVEPEMRLGFRMMDQTPKKSLLESLFFFRAMGFGKPEDQVMHLLGGCCSEFFVVHVCIGPRGLTRMSMIALETSDNVAKELANQVNFKYDQAGVTKIEQILRARPNAVEYGATSRGYVIGIGFTTEPPPPDLEVTHVHGLNVAVDRANSKAEASASPASSPR